MSVDSGNGKIGPPSAIEGTVRFLLPPLSREAVLGDLFERYRSPLQYVLEAFSILPFLIVSQTRRTVSAPTLGLQLFTVWACLGGFQARPDGVLWKQAAIPAVAALLGVVLRDVYRISDERSLRRAVLDVAVIAIFIAASQMLIHALTASGYLSSEWFLGARWAILALCILPVVCVLRTGVGLEQISRSRREHGSSFGELADDYSHFARGVRWRNRAEVIAISSVVLVSIWFLATLRPHDAPYTSLLLAGFTCLAVYLAVRGYSPSLPLRITFSELRALFRKELVRQHVMRRFMWWYWFAPLFLGLTNNFTFPGFFTGRPQQILLGVALTLSLGLCIAGLLRERGLLVMSKLDALERMYERGG